MPLKLDTLFGNKGYYANRTKMLNQLNEINKSPYVYFSDPASRQQMVRDTMSKYPEQASDLMEENTNAKIKALNIIDFMDMDDKHANNPFAQLGAQGANTQLRMPIGWVDDAIPTDPKNKSVGYYHKNKDMLTIPMYTMGPQNRLNGDNTIVHEIMHRGFNKLGTPGMSTPAVRASSPVSEHNYIYNKMRSEYGDTQYTQNQIDSIWPARPAFRHETQDSRNNYINRFKGAAEKAAWNRLGGR